MKHILIILEVAAFIALTPESHAMFGHTAAERERRVAVEHKLELVGQQLVQQEQTANRWETIAFALGIGSVVTLVAGAAIGSNGRKNAKPAK